MNINDNNHQASAASDSAGEWMKYKENSGSLNEK